MRIGVEIMGGGEVITRIAARGDGVTASGHHIAGGVPGDVIGEDGGLIPGPNRQTPPCLHFERCGGCQLQHVNDHAYGNYLVDRIISALAAQGIDAPDIMSPILSPPYSRRRVALRAQSISKKIILGYAEGASHTLVDLRACPVMDPILYDMIRPLRALMAILITSRRVADLRMTLTDQGVDLLIAGVEAQGLAVAEALNDFAIMHKLARLSIDEGYGPSVRWEPEPVTVTFGGVAVGMPHNAFLQATAHGEAALVGVVRSVVKGAAHVADLFSGLGTFALATGAIGTTGAKVHAVEGARDAALALQMAANQMKRALSVEHRDLFRRPLTPAELARFDAVILDPPRAGAYEQVEQLAQSIVAQLVYVSCNPATFARDAKLLIAGGYALKKITPVGQFRWSTHVELAAVFGRVVPS